MWSIPRTLVIKILGHAQQSLPEECVGLLSGQGETILAWHPLSNRLHSPRQFMADEAELVAQLRQIRENGQELVAIYHSHPNAPAVPSAADLQQSYYPNALYLIVSLQTHGRLEMNGYRIQENQAVWQALTVLD